MCGTTSGTGTRYHDRPANRLRLRRAAPVTSPPDCDYKSDYDDRAFTFRNVRVFQLSDADSEVKSTGFQKVDDDYATPLRLNLG